MSHDSVMLDVRKVDSVRRKIFARPEETHRVVYKK
jgi:hypothetical protein